MNMNTDFYNEIEVTDIQNTVDNDVYIDYLTSVLERSANELCVLSERLKCMNLEDEHFMVRLDDLKYHLNENSKTRDNAQKLLIEHMIKMHVHRISEKMLN